MKGSILAYIIAGALTVTAVAVGVSIVKADSSDKSLLLQEKVGNQHSNILSDANSDSDDKHVNFQSEEQGKIGESNQESEKYEDNNESDTQSGNGENYTELAKEIIDIDGVELEGGAGLSEVDKSRLVIVSGGDEEYFSDYDTEEEYSTESEGSSLVGSNKYVSAAEKADEEAERASKVAEQAAEEAKKADADKKAEAERKAKEAAEQAERASKAAEEAWNKVLEELEIEESKKTEEASIAESKKKQELEATYENINNLNKALKSETSAKGKEVGETEYNLDN